MQMVCTLNTRVEKVDTVVWGKVVCTVILAKRYFVFGKVRR